MADETAPDEELNLRADQLRLLAHDLNNPLTAIRILAEMLHDEQSNVEARRDLRDVLEAADMASGLIEGMAALISLDLKRSQDMTWFPMNLSGVVREAVDRPALLRHVVLDVPDELPYAGDRRALVAAICDILLNARKVVEGELQIEVYGRQVPEGVQLRVRHPGSGIPEASRTSLMRRFGPVDLRNQRIPVSAVGLAYAQHVVHSHGGTLSFTDDPDGTMVLVMTLPRT